MKIFENLFIGGQWVRPLEPRIHDVVNPATEAVCAQVTLGGALDVDRAVLAAREAFPAFSATTSAERIALLNRIIKCYTRRSDDLADGICQAIGSPISLCRAMQVPSGLGHFAAQVQVLESFAFREQRGGTAILREPIGVVGLITPWNWPMNMICCKVAPALAAGCTIVLKPSEVSPLDAFIFAEILEEAGVPHGVFNLVLGAGAEVGAAMASHPDIDAISITGSTRAGIDVAKKAADSVKRVSQELGGKSANIILEDADLAMAVGGCVQFMMLNSGQTCFAPSRVLAPRSRYDEIVALAVASVDQLVIGDPLDPMTTLGPVASRAQFERIQKMVAQGIDEGAKLACGGLGKPAGVDQGYYVRPTILTAVSNTMAIAREEIFGPVLCIIPYDDEDEAVSIANDSPYGLAGFVQGGDLARAVKVGDRIRAGTILINHAGLDLMAPFGGYKMSGNGREFGEHGLSEFLETKTVVKPV